MARIVSASVPMARARRLSESPSRSCEGAELHVRIVIAQRVGARERGSPPISTARAPRLSGRHDAAAQRGIHVPQHVFIDAGGLGEVRERNGTAHVDALVVVLGRSRRGGNRRWSDRWR